MGTDDQVRERAFEFVDAHGARRRGEQKLVPVQAIRAGTVYAAQG